LILLFLAVGCASAPPVEKGEIRLAGDGGILLESPEEALVLLASLHADRSIVWPGIERSDRVAVPRLDLEGGRILVPPMGWSSHLPADVAESIGTTSGTIPERFRGGAFGSLLENILVWCEAHVGLIQGRLAYGNPTREQSEELAVKMTVAALRSLPPPSPETIREHVSEYLAIIGVSPARDIPSQPEEVWDRGGEEVRPAWDRIELHLGTLAYHLEGRARSLGRIIDEEMLPQWERGLHRRGAIPDDRWVQTIPMTGKPITSIASDADGGIYLLRDGDLEVLGGDGETVLLLSGDRGFFRAEHFVVTGPGKFLLVGSKEFMSLGFPEREVRRWGPVPWRNKGRITALSVGPDGALFAAIGSEVLRVDENGEIADRVRAESTIGGIAFVGDALHVSLPDLHRIDALADGEFRAVAGGVAPGFQDGRDIRLGRPMGLAATPDGDLACADARNHAVRIIHLADGSGSTLAGGGAGRRDGPGRDALFFSPFALTCRSGATAVIEPGLQGIRLVGDEPDPRSTVPEWARAIRPPSEVYSHIDRARALARNEKTGEALEELDLAVEGSAIDRNLYVTLLERGRIHAGLGDHEKASVDFQRAAHVAPGEMDAPMGAASALIHLGKPEEGEAILVDLNERFLRKPPLERHRDDRYAEVLRLQAEARKARELWDDALKSADDAVRAKELGVKLYDVEWKPEDSRLYITRGYLHLNKDQPEEALADFDRAAELSRGATALTLQGRGEALAGRGDALAEVGKSQEAAESYREALTLSDEIASAHLGLARLYSKPLDNSDRALSHLERYLELGGLPEVAGEILSNLTATSSDRTGSYAEAIVEDDEGNRWRIRIYDDGKRVKTPVED
jgi:tetratricopeptide (TPR) repeat protein